MKKCNNFKVDFFIRGIEGKFHKLNEEEAMVFLNRVQLGKIKIIESAFCWNGDSLEIRIYDMDGKLLPLETKGQRTIELNISSNLDEYQGQLDVVTETINELKENLSKLNEMKIEFSVEDN